MARTPVEGPGPYYVLGEFIAQRRRARRMSQAELARRVGVSAGYIGHIERGTREVSDRVLRRLADALGVDPLELYSRRAFGAPPVGDVAIHVAPEKAAYVRFLAGLPTPVLRFLHNEWRYIKQAHLGEQADDERTQNGAQQHESDVEQDEGAP
jgi:transcriptional regulator with XRE-family HTH domain